jgi:hypothetical protein
MQDQLAPETAQNPTAYSVSGITRKDLKKEQFAGTKKIKNEFHKTAELCLGNPSVRVNVLNLDKAPARALAHAVVALLGNTQSGLIK